MKGIRKRVLENLAITEKAETSLGYLTKGARLVLGKSGKEALVVAVDHGANKVEVLIGDLRLKTSIDELEHIEGVRVVSRQGPKDDTPGTTTPSAPSVTSSSPLNLIGLTVDEALPIVDKALDQALLWGEKDVHIIHGVGTGRLRKAIHDYLQQQPGIRSFYPGKPHEGGAGMTIVELDA